MHVFFFIIRFYLHHDDMKRTCAKIIGRTGTRERGAPEPGELPLDSKSPSSKITIIKKVNCEVRKTGKLNRLLDYNDS